MGWAYYPLGQSMESLYMPTPWQRSPSELVVFPLEVQRQREIKPNHETTKIVLFDTLERINKKTEQTRMLFGPIQRVHSGRIPDHCNWPKLKESFDYVQTQEHSFAIEKGCRWLSREDRLCAHYQQNEVETELHFLTSCQMYDHIRDTYFPQNTQIYKEFENKPNFDKLPYLLGEIPQCAITAARFVSCCHKKRSTSE